MGGDQPQEETPGGPWTAGAPPCTVLVVDGDPRVRSWIVRALDVASIRAIAVRDGREAHRLVADGHARPDVLLTDITMPGMSGVELAARLRALCPGLRVVMMTGDPSSAEIARAHDSIVDTVLVKPMAGEDVLAAIRPRDRAPVR
jgi:DNA-binding response OmpR family regulator